MTYSIDEFSVYKKMNIKGKDVLLFEDHNMALPVWGDYSSKINCAMSLISFDYYTDTRAPFTGMIIEETGKLPLDYSRKDGLNDPTIKKLLSGCHYLRSDFDFKTVCELAMASLENDEHILTAYHFEYIDCYTIICELDDCDARRYEEEDRGMGFNASIIERSRIMELNSLKYSTPIILDFDLCYFTARRCFSDEFIRNVTELIRNASIITIATEPDYFNGCVQEEGFKNEEALDMLIQIINDALE